MAGELRTRNAAVLVKIETTEGVDAAPVASDAILVEEITLDPGTGTIPSTEITGAIDTGVPQVIGAPTTCTIRARLRGPVGAPASGNLPPLDALLQACGLERVVQDGIAGGGTITAGTTNTITGASGLSTTAQIYRGMPLVLGVGVHAPRITGIWNYTSGRVASLTETFSPAISTSHTADIVQNVLYRPRTAGIPSVTIYRFVDGKRRRIVGARGSVSVAMNAANIPVATFTMTGTWVGEDDAAVPAVSPLGHAAPLFKQIGLDGAFTIDSLPVGISSFTLNFNAELTSPADPNTPNGFGPGLLVNRDVRINFAPQQQLVATRDVIGGMFAGTTFRLMARANGAVGNRLLIIAPSCTALAAPDQDDAGIQRHSIEAKAGGANSGATLCFY